MQLLSSNLGGEFPLNTMSTRIPFCNVRRYLALEHGFIRNAPIAATK